MNGPLYKCNNVTEFNSNHHLTVRIPALFKNTGNLFCYSMGTPEEENEFAQDGRCQRGDDCCEFTPKLDEVFVRSDDEDEDDEDEFLYDSVVIDQHDDRATM